MSEQSSNLQLPFLQAGQAQKHVTVNESLLLLDALVQLAVASATTTTQPGSPADGAAYILPAGKTGADWGAMANNALAYYRDGAWAAIAPREGWLAFVKDSDKFLAFDGTNWGDLGVTGAAAAFAFSGDISPAATGSTGGGGGAPGGGSGGSGVNAANVTTNGTGSGGGGGGNAAAGGTGGICPDAPTGGGAGGGIAATPVNTSGGSARKVVGLANDTFGSSGANGAAGQTGSGKWGTGGGGGGGGSNAAGAGYAGGAAGNYGGGGGGGGSGVGGNGGAGGVGGGGYVSVVTWF